MKTVSNKSLKILAERCGLDTEIQNGKLRLVNNPAVEWSPHTRDDQNYKLLKAVIAREDCELFIDDGFYFIYQFKSDGDKIPLCHNEDLNDAVIEAALELWCQETKEEE